MPLAARLLRADALRSLLVALLLASCGGDERAPVAPTDGGRSRFDSSFDAGAPTDAGESPDAQVDPRGCGDCDGLDGNGCEITLEDDPNHCGACFNVCPIRDNARTACVGGVCSFTCTGGFADCDREAANGCEVQTTVSTDNCGACGEVCVAQPNSAVECSGGSCSNTCLEGYASCDGRSDNGCERETASDIANCGACGTTCPVRANSMPVCNAGTCGIECNEGFADCDGRADTGCEVDVRTSMTHCGACGSSCAPSRATAACTAGVCEITACNTGYGDCNGDIADGCEAPLNTLTNCSTCGTACMLDSATASCSTRMCVIQSCNTGYLDCNDSDGDGCEVSSLTDESNCGTCGNVCAPPNATPVCSSGTCGISSCDPGYANCNSTVNDGCEISIATNASHCGACGNACPTVAQATATCTSGTCGFTCNSGRADCDGLAGNGCEISTATDPENCGSCGTVCLAGGVNTVGVCSGGVCGVQCRTGYADCNGDPADGCEINSRTNVSHCGGCGNACMLPPGAANAGVACSGGDCVLDCYEGYSNCDSDDSNGCETAGTSCT